MPVPATKLGAPTVSIGGTEEPVRNITLRLTQSFNITGHPAISMPCGKTDEGLPVGAQIVGTQKPHSGTAGSRGAQWKESWSARASTVLPRLGTSPRVTSRRIASSGRSTGASTGSVQRTPSRLPEERVAAWVDEVMRDTPAFFEHAADVRLRLHRRHRPNCRRGARPARCASRARSSRRTPRTTPSSAAGFRRRRVAARQTQRPWTRRRRDVAVELGQRRSHRAVEAAGAIRRVRAAHQPALSRRTHAARVDARRLHRQLEHRADGAGLSSGGARRTTSVAVAGVAGLRADRHSRHESRLVSLAADVGARTADPGTGAQSRLSLVRRRRVARPLDASRARRDSNGHIDLERLRSLWRPISSVRLSRSHTRQAHAARLREVRPDVPGRSLRDSGQRVPQQTAAARSLRAALRALQQRSGAVQVHRWVCADQVSCEESY